MSYAFISFSTKNQSTAEGLKELLEKNGFSSWLASDDINGGDNYLSDITAAISGCSCLIVLLSKEAQESVWVPKEVETAMSLKKKVIPIDIDGTPLDQTFTLMMKGCNIINFRQLAEKGQMRDKLLLTVRKSLEGTETDEEPSSGGRQQSGADDLFRQRKTTVPGIAAAFVQAVAYPAGLSVLYGLTRQSAFSLGAIVPLMLLPAVLCCVINGLIGSFSFKRTQNAAPYRTWWICSFIGMILALAACTLINVRFGISSGVLGAACVNCLPFCLCGFMSLGLAEKHERV